MVFIKEKLKGNLAILLATLFFVGGCNTAQWFQVVRGLLPLAVQVATQFYSYANRGAVDPGDQALIQEYAANAKNILMTIQDAVKAVSNPGDVSAIQKVDALLKQLQTDSNTLLASLHVKDANTIAFVNALLADAVDLAGLVPVVTSSPGPITQAAVRASVTTQIRQSTIRASALKSVFQSRLDSLPK